MVFIDGANFEKKPFHFTSGNKSHKEFTDLSNPLGILLGTHTIATSFAPGTKDASPVSSDSLCYQQKRILTKGINAADTVIEVNDPTCLNEIASWEGHCADLNMIKIGKELIHYLGVSKTKPYTLQKVQRAIGEQKRSATGLMTLLINYSVPLIMVMPGSFLTFIYRTKLRNTMPMLVISTGLGSWISTARSSYLTPDRVIMG